MTVPIPVKVDAQVDVAAADSCNCSCPTNCCFSIGRKKHRHRNSCEIKVNNLAIVLPPKEPTLKESPTYGQMPSVVKV